MTVVPDDLAHDRFGHRAEGVIEIADFAEELVGVCHPVVDDPFDDATLRSPVSMTDSEEKSPRIP